MIFWQTCVRKTKQNKTKQNNEHDTVTHTSIAVKIQESDTSIKKNKQGENSLVSKTRETRAIWVNSKSNSAQLGEEMFLLNKMGCDFLTGSKHNIVKKLYF